MLKPGINWQRPRRGAVGLQALLVLGMGTLMLAFVVIQHGMFSSRQHMSNAADAAALAAGQRWAEQPGDLESATRAAQRLAAMNGAADCFCRVTVCPAVEAQPSCDKLRVELLRTRGRKTQKDAVLLAASMVCVDRAVVGFAPTASARIPVVPLALDDRQSEQLQRELGGSSPEDGQPRSIRVRLGGSQASAWLLRFSNHWEDLPQQFSLGLSPEDLHDSEGKVLLGQAISPTMLDHHVMEHDSDIRSRVINELRALRDSRVVRVFPMISWSDQHDPSISGFVSGIIDSVEVDGTGTLTIVITTKRVSVASAITSQDRRVESAQGNSLIAKVRLIVE